MNSETTNRLVISAGIAVLLMGSVITFQVIRLTNIMDDRTDRITKQIEAIGHQVDRLGGAAVDKAREAIGEMDAVEMGKGAQEGIKKIGGAARDRAVEYFKNAKD